MSGMKFGGRLSLSHLGSLRGERRRKIHANSQEDDFRQVEVK
jgi:hypothetical protein